MEHYATQSGYVAYINGKRIKFPTEKEFREYVEERELDVR